MKKTVKALWILLGTGAVGLALTIGIALGAGMIGSTEDTKTYDIVQPFESVELDTYEAQVSFIEAEDESSVQAYAKAWLEYDLVMDDLIDIDVTDGVLKITEQPFPDEFFGAFPQPYELSIILSVPSEVIDGMGGSA